MVRQTLLRDLFSAAESAEPAYLVDVVDEYRELVMLALAWERDSLKPGAAEGVSGRVADADGKESALL